MGLFDWLKSIGQPASSANVGQEIGQTIYWNPYGNIYQTVNHMSVDDAYAVATYQSCVELIASQIGSSPAKLKKDQGANGYIVDEAHPLSELFCGTANGDGIPWILVVENLVRNALNEGNGYAWIKRDPKNPSKVQLWSLPAHLVSQVRTEEFGLLYIIFDPFTRQPKFRVTPDELIHLRGKNNDGYIGKSVLATNATTIGVARDAQKFGHKFYLQGTNLGGMIKTTQKLDDKGMQTLVQSMKGGFNAGSGLDSSFRIGILPFGAEFEQFSGNLSDGQYEETRRYQDLQIARLFNVPPAILGIIESGDKSTEQQGLNFLKFCLGPWFVRLEKELEQKLLQEGEERKTYRIRFNADAILRADYTTRVDGFVKLRTAGVATVNDWNRQEDLPLVPEGDVRLTPLNMAPSTAAPSTKPPEPAQPPAPTVEAPAAQAAVASAQPQPATDYRGILSPVVSAAVVRLMTKEGNALRQAYRRSVIDQQWGTLFYSTHRALVSEALTPIRAQALCLGLTPPESDELAARYCDAQTGALPSGAAEVDDWQSASRDAQTKLIMDLLIGDKG